MVNTNVDLLTYLRLSFQNITMMLSVKPTLHIILHQQKSPEENILKAYIKYLN